MNTETRQIVRQKFHSIFGSHLKVGVQSNFSLGHEIEDPKYAAHGMAREYAPGEILHVHHPAVELEGGDLREHDEIVFGFCPTIDLAPAYFHQLALFRRSKQGRPTTWMVCGRNPTPLHPEHEVFGFSADHSAYLNLALPGEVEVEEKKIFVPLYIKMRDPRWPLETFLYLRIIAREMREPENGARLIGWQVKAEKLGRDDERIPRILREARP